jgi:zinc D-Ala-D-Ala carboxypeptidase
MFWLRKLSDIVNALFRSNGRREEVAVDTSDEPLLRLDEQLSPHFSLFELTTTSNKKLQEENRTLTYEQMCRLIILANHAESIREICGNAPVRVHSGYRSDSLNGATSGSSSASQHPRCEALDMDVMNQSVEDTFNKLLAAARVGKFKFGQLIIEKAGRDYGVSQWVHCSIIGTLDTTKVGQVMRMTEVDGKFNYVLIDHLKF